MKSARALSALLLTLLTTTAAATPDTGEYLMFTDHEFKSLVIRFERDLWDSIRRHQESGQAGDVTFTQRQLAEADEHPYVEVFRGADRVLLPVASEVSTFHRNQEKRLLLTLKFDRLSLNLFLHPPYETRLSAQASNPDVETRRLTWVNVPSDEFKAHVRTIEAPAHQMSFAQLDQCRRWLNESTRADEWRLVRRRNLKTE